MDDRAMPVSREHSQRAWSPWELTKTLGMKNYLLVCCWLLSEVLVSEASKWLGEVNEVAQPFSACVLLFWGLELGSQYPHPLAQNCRTPYFWPSDTLFWPQRATVSTHRPIRRHTPIVKNKICFKKVRKINIEAPLKRENEIERKSSLFSLVSFLGRMCREVQVMGSARDCPLSGNTKSFYENKIQLVII